MTTSPTSNGMRLTLFTYTLFFALVTAGLHLLALRYSLYWIFSWFDCIVHFFGGLMAAYLLGALFHPYLPIKRRILFMVLAVLCVGLLWEFFEYTFGISSHELRYWGDTLSDLIFDLLGGLLGGIAVHRILKKSYGSSGA
jgi:hypothetical protein